MQFLNIVIVPSFILILSVILQFWISGKEFSDYYKLFVFGILSGIAILVINSFLKFIYEGSAHHLTIFLKVLLIDGFLFSGLICIGLFFIYTKFMDLTITSTWSMTTVMTFSYIAGIMTSINFYQSINGIYPNSPLIYFSLFSFLIFISMIIGIGLPQFIDSYEISKKILWGIFTIGILTISITIYSYLRFYDYYEHYFFIAVFAIMAVFFEIFDFKMFRGR